MTAAPVPLLVVADLAELEDKGEEKKKERTPGIFLAPLGPLLYLDLHRPVAVATLVPEDLGKKEGKKEAKRREK